MRAKSQIRKDEDRETYLVAFPQELDSDRVLAWLRSISGTLPKRSSSSLAKNTLVFETWATSAGITHRLMIPRSAAEYVATQLRAHGQGITVVKDDSRPELEWTDGVEVGMSSPLRQLRVKKHSDLAASLLGSVSALRDGETVLTQWVVTPARLEHLPAREDHVRSADFHVRAALLSAPLQATSDELQDRRAKLDEPNVIGIGRIMAHTDNPKRAAELVLRVESALSAANSAANYFKSKTPGKSFFSTDTMRKLVQRANEAASVMLFPAQFSLTELAGVIGWPIGQPFVAGLSRSTSRRLFPTSDVPEVGRRLGFSNYEGHERTIALSYEYATRHMTVVGGSGTGKTVFLANCLLDDVSNGYGAFVIDAGDSRSDETLYSRFLASLPPELVEKVIIIDPAADRDNPIGFNILEQGNPRSVARRVGAIFKGLFNDTSSGVWTPQLLFHGIYTLADHGGLSFPDILPLLNPRTEQEKAWAKNVIDSVKDRDIRDWWRRWEDFDARERDAAMKPLYNRIWSIVNNPEVRNIIGQSTSSFSIRDALLNNQIVLINLASMDEETAKLLGSFFFDAIWHEARQLKPDKPNFLYLDEFQVMTAGLSLPLDDVLSRARKHNLGIAMATQYFSEKIPRDVQSAAINNAQTKVVFRVSSSEARTWNPEFDKHIDTNDITSLGNFEALAKIASTAGQTAVSLRTRPPARLTGATRRAIEHSRRMYGRPIASVQAERDARVSAPVKERRKRPPMGYSR